MVASSDTATPSREADAIRQVHQGGDDSGLADEPLTAGGSTADHQDGNDVLREQLLLTVVEEGTGYVVSFAALEQRWDDYAELAEASLLSLSTE